MLEIRDGKIINQFMEANSKLEQYNQKGVRVHNLVDDEQGNLWMVNFGTENPIKFLDGEGKWKAFEYETLKGKIPGGLISATNGYKWGFIHDSPNLFVIDDFDTPANIKDDKVLIVEPKDFNGTSFTDEIYAIVEDQEGNLWIATDEGISVDFEPGNVFQRDIYQPSRIRITREGYTQYMLRDNYVTDMAADPANQIWFATKTAGVFVYNPDKQTVVDHFTSRNSPLLTDTIQALTINKKGEVFISTSKGIISYRSETSEGREDFSETYAFPNPVPPDYSGIITITNLVEDVNVKITDISGNLVYETIANGGQATWNGKNFSGQRVSSGVYLIFLTNEDGSKTHVEKLLFIK
jgi:ligand-binding sensor domain-containing protein